MTDRKADLLDQKATLIGYLASRLKAGDFHAVQDAASDIREIDAKLELLGQIEANIAPGRHQHVFHYDASLDANICVCGRVNPMFQRTEQQIG